MPNHSLEYLRGLNVGLIVNWADFDRWPVLPLIVCDLADELRQAIDR
jgi:hypothetical protein